MAFSTPKRSPTAASSALKVGIPDVAPEALLLKPENILYHLDAFYLPAKLLWKRILDIILSVSALILLSPLMAIAGALVKMTSRGPVLFHQTRIGLDRRSTDRRQRCRQFGGPDRRLRERRVTPGYGRPFQIYKFRTMVLDAEGSGKPMLARKGDPRITPLGAIMRKTRIDELPQFVNVLKGDMSIVGPRPERAFFIDEMKKEIPNFQFRLRTKPGITGLAQVELGYANDVEGMRNKLRYDLKYIQSQNIYTDLRILFKTVSVVLTGKGAC